MWNYVRAVFGFVFVVGIASQALAQDQAERERMTRAVEKVLHDPASYDAAMEAGRERTLLCSQCHGVTGNSRSPEIPNLAGQNPTYLLEQIEKFADGRRKNFVMRSLARSFTFEDKVNLAIYFASQQVEPVDADPALAVRGEAIFTSVCQACHGANGRGDAGYARLAGQKVEYVEQTLKRFRANARQRLEPSQMTRHNVRMEQVAQNLSDDEIIALANYIALLK